MAMTTRCPHCGTAFKVVADQLRVRNGLVRCGLCSRVFDGYAAMVEGPGSAPPVRRPDAGPDSGGAAGTPASPVLSVRAPAQTPVAPSPPVYRQPAAPPVPGPRLPDPEAFAAPAVLRGRDDSRPGPWRTEAAYTRHAGPLAGAHDSYDAPDMDDADNDDDRAGFRAPYAPHRQDDARDTEQPGREADLRGRDPYRIYARREPIEDEPDYVSIPGEARTRYDDTVDAGMAPPVFMDEEVQRRRSLMARLWVVGCLLGIVVLGLQWIYVYRTPIAAAVPSLRPALETVCGQLGCQVGYGRRLERISITASSLQPPSGAAGMDDGRMRLVLAVTLRNRYDKPQPWPALVLQLTDLSDTVVVRKVLLPESYLPPGVQGPFPAGGEISVSVPLQVAGLHVNGYQLDKFFP
jgi:predicted Zn finger-like uncharacterized protein